MRAEVQFYVGPPTAEMGDGHIVIAKPEGGLITRLEILAFWQSQTLPAIWSELDADDKDEKRYLLKRTKRMTNRTIQFIAEKRHGLAYTNGNAAEKAAFEAEAQTLKDNAQADRDLWTGTGPGEGVGIDTNWGYRIDLSGQFGIVMADLPKSGRLLREFDYHRRPVDHTAEELQPKQFLRISRWRVPYETLGIDPQLIADWKTDGLAVPVDRNQVPFTAAQVKGVIA